ncbi:MAG: GAF domain-containing sensor histidine kinase [Candidatus Gastranaerophilaceae bacterium]
MNTKNRELKHTGGFEDLSRGGLVLELEHARAETFKYVNKFLEVEEKWAFINLLLKKLNSIRQKQELCKTICEGFLTLTNSMVCVCCLFNQDHRRVEFKNIAYGEKVYNKKKLMEFIEKVNLDCCNFLEKSSEIEDIYEYFESLSEKKLIIVPIIYSNIFLGYLMLKKEDSNFYKNNIHFINIFPEHIALILENISLYQESEKRNKSKIEFLAGISHEFKTPLNSIIGFSEILKAKAQNRENFKYINNILQSSKHLLTLIEDVLDVSKSQSNILELNYTLFSPKNEISQIVLALEKMVQEKDISLNYTLTDIKISADIKRFRQLIYNLVSNAIKFNKQNGKINILTYVKEGKFFFEITDTGDGISKRSQEKIFDFFSQVNRSQLKRQLGSGVGLALCKIITDAHKGEINFKSKIKKGSSFWFSLPISE